MVFDFENTYIHLPPSFYAEATPTPVSNPHFIAWNKNLAEELGLRNSKLSEEQLALFFSGGKLPHGSQPIATAYAGHQFGHLSPVLGDGRALLMGEVIHSDGHRYDIQLKGAGKTPFSRGGSDGRSPLGPVLREYIVSEAMFRLGVPTTRALAAVGTGEVVYRERDLPGAVFTRVASSHIRVGTFEYFAYRNDSQGLETLLKYSVERHYSHIKESSNLPLDFLKEVVKAQAHLIAHWMSLGFIHGVMNTDNTSVAGITIDYGPCAFMDYFNSIQVYSSIDRQGRYAYGNQPAIASWNLVKLAEALILLYPQADRKSAVQKFEEQLEAFLTLYFSEWLKRMSWKLGLTNYTASDRELVKMWLSYLEKEKLDYTSSFRELSQYIDSPIKSEKLKKTDELFAFETRWKTRIHEQNASPQAIKERMDKLNPVYIPRNHNIEKVIEEGEKGNFAPFHELNEVLKEPYKGDSVQEIWSRPPQPYEVVKETFCGT